MKSRNTWIWFSLAVGLFVFIYFFEQNWRRPQPELGAPTPLLVDLRPDKVTSLQVRRGAQAAHLRREGSTWRMTLPLAYPVNPVKVENLLGLLARLDCRTVIPATKLEDFGLGDPAAIVVINQGEQRMELQVGSLTPVGDQVYVRAVGRAGVYTADASLWHQAIPETANDWRSLALLAASASFAFDRFEVRSATRGLGYALGFNPTNRTWRLGKPMQARANQTKTGQLLLSLLEARVNRFVTDDPAADPARYGCAPPELELVLGVGTNDLLTVQFGRSPTNEPALVYARCLSHTNVVLVRRDLVESLRAPYTELRDRHLFNFEPAVVQQIEVAGEGAFSLRRQTNGTWRVMQPQEYAADPVLMRELLGELFAWEVAAFEKDVVTDFAPYGLAPPLREVLLKTSLTNSAGLTNVVVAQASLSTNVAGKFYARRMDENSVFAIEEGDLFRLPQQGWQLRDRRVWNFAVSNVVRVTVRDGGRANQFVRQGTNDWAFGPGGQGIMNEPAVEEAVMRLGELTALYWVDRGEGSRERHGFPAEGLRFEVEVRAGADRLQTFTLEFGPVREARIPLGCVTLDGQPWIFEFPPPIHQLLLRELPLPKPTPTAGP
jgi:hypothetical protein